MRKRSFSLVNFNNQPKKKTRQRLFFYLFVILIIIIGYFFTFFKIYDNRIYPNVFCSGNFNLGGLTKYQASELLNVWVDKIETGGFSFYVQDQAKDTPINIPSQLIAPTDPDLSRSLLSFDVDSTVKSAFNVGRNNNFFQKIKQITFDVNKKKKVDLIFWIDKVQLIHILEENFGELDNPAKNAKIEYSKDKNELILIKEEVGTVLNYTKAIDDLIKNLGLLKNNKIEITFVEDGADINSGQLSNIIEDARDLLSSAPYSLTFEEKKWQIKLNDLADWLDSGKNNLNEISLFFKKDKISSYLDEIAGEINIDPVSPRLAIENMRVSEFKKGSTGINLPIDDNVKIIIKEIFQKNKNIELKIDVTEPEPLPEDLNSLGINELLADGRSNFSGSPSNRIHNINVGTDKLNGILILPDEEFSLIKALGNIDEEAGFLAELVIKGDRTVPEYGGGLCQIATTTFRTAINAGLPITERQNHSYRVSYYEPAGTDATIYNPRPDLKFINDTSNHILFQAEINIDKKELIFRFYGTSDNRKVITAEPTIFNIVEPGPIKYIKTDELLPGEKEKVESAHYGADAKFKNTVIFANGIKREEEWNSHYKPWEETWLIGRQVEAEQSTDSLLDEVDSN
ncbi:VanW family protein [Patescibacteria group bacterium]|nr:VanW family protein [Patescibacteria group bacterium]